MKKKGSWLFGLSSNISGEKVGRRRFGRAEKFSPGEYSGGLEKLSALRVYIFYIVTFAVLVLFIGRLFILTVVFGNTNRQLADTNRIQLVNLPAPRGKILDRNGIVLASSEKVFFLDRGTEEKQITQEQVGELEKLGLAGENFEGELGKIRGDVSRHYPLGDAASHVVGYTNGVQKEDIANNSQLGLFEKIGRDGVEATYDDFLRGIPGQKLIEVDAVGKKISILNQENSKAGRDIYTTIDSRFQKVLFEALSKQADKIGTKRGAAIVENVQTGEILALVSLPAYNGEDIAKSVMDVNKPFLNRAVSGVYPPGSVFKLVTAMAGLQSGIITKDTEIEDTGHFELGGSTFSNWFYLEFGKTDGLLKIERAIARSNDVFFFRVGEKIGHGQIKKMAVQLGYGQKTGIDLPNEAYGLVPDEVWKESAYHQDWFLGDTLHMAIGQGFVQTTPLQVEQVTSFAASGILHKPFLVSKIASGNGAGEVDIGPKTVSANLVKSENLDIVRSGMRQACQTGGTAFPFFDAPYSVGCKTGTAEKVLGNPHAWFSAYAPFEKPEIAVTIIIEDGGEGSVVSAPVAREVLDWWFKNLKR